MEPWKCDPCGKCFSGLVCFQQHEASEKHKKKVRLMNGVSFGMPNPVNPPDSMQQVHCSMCQVSISGWDNYQKHVNSLEHAIMVQKKNNDLLSSYVSSTFELKTEGNQLMESTVSLASATKLLTSFAECKPCQKEFSGPEPYQQHLASAGHRKKCGSSMQMMQIDETDSIIRKKNINENLLNDPQSSESTCDPTEKIHQFFARCDICAMEFSGDLPYQIHLVSDNHKMKASNQLLGNSIAESQSACKCDICLMTFTGPVPYQQHLVSNGHRKKMNTANLSKLASTGALSPPDSTLKDSQVAHEQFSITDRKWYCDTCKIQCSGPIPFNTHILGREHTKNLRILVVEENLRKVKVSGLFPFVGNGEVHTDLYNKVSSTSSLHMESEIQMEESPDECKINNLNINAKSNDTKILSDKFKMNVNDLIALPNLNIIPPGKLDVTVFEPDDEIVFSNSKK